MILAGLLLMPTRPRLHADAEAVRLRGFLGGWRTVPWDVVRRGRVPGKVRFARLVLPGDETLAIYAVQRLDKEQASTRCGGCAHCTPRRGDNSATRQFVIMSCRDN